MTRDSRFLAPLLAIVLAAATAVAAVTAAGPASATTYAPVSEDGSSWAFHLVDGWRAAVHTTMTVYAGSGGSVSGLQEFANHTVDFAVSDLPYGLADGSSPAQPARSSTYVPIAAGGLVLPYNLTVGGQRVENLRLSSAAIAGIFAGTITSWDDPAITTTNKGLALPALKIIPVVHGEGAGSTRVLTRWLNAVQPEVWTCGERTVFAQCPSYDASVHQAKQGESGVLGFISQPITNGSIGYAENSSALASGLPVASVQNAGGDFTLPTSTNVAVSLTRAGTNADQTANLDDVYAFRDYRVYPLAHYSYAVIPTSSADGTPDAHQTVAAFLTYGLCAGQKSAALLGYAPLPLNLVEAGLAQIRRLGPDADGGAVPGVTIPTVADAVAHCDNPTFDKTDLSRDVLGLGIDGVPASSGTPRVAGTVRVGAELAVHVGTWRHTRRYAVQWLANGSPIVGATKPLYAVRAAALGKHLSVRVTAISGDQQRTTVTSARTAAVAKGRLAIDGLAVGGNLRVGRRVYAAGSVMATSPQAQTDIPGNWPLYPVGNPVARYQWYAGGEPIRGATLGYLTLGRAQAGKRLTVRVVARAAGFVTLAKVSPRSGVVRR